MRRAPNVSFDADLNGCAALVERGDPLRFRAAMAVPVAARRILFPLYAFNVEVARAPWVTQEPMIAEMRLQWWRDVCEEIAEGKPVRRHEVATPLAAVLMPGDVQHLDRLVAARRWDIYKDAFEDDTHFARYIDETAGNLTWVAARLLGPADEQTVRDAAFASGVAALFVAIPELEARGRIPLLDGTAEGVVALANQALSRLANARRNRGLVPKASRAALLHVGAAAPILKAVVSEPGRVAASALPDPVAQDQTRLAFRALSGRW